jgi:hypothetical protein
MGLWHVVAVTGVHGGRFGLWQVADKADLAGAFWQVIRGVTGCVGARHGLALSSPKQKGRLKAAFFRFDPEGEISFFAPYYQDTKSSIKTGQISLRV